MHEVFDINISHQTIANYAQSASNIINPWLNNYQYDLSSYLCGDENYIKVKGKRGYVFFICDSINKIITSHKIYMKRDSFSAIQAFYSTLRKFKVIPEDLKIVVDGNPIYLVAKQYFQLLKINFEVPVVVGLKDTNIESKKHRPAKQIIERLNRTFNYSYYVKNGFKTLDSANEFMCLFTTYFNFLRKHSSLGHKPPVELQQLENINNMPTKWQILLELAVKSTQEDFKL
jgi:transposase-like protein